MVREEIARRLRKLRGGRSVAEVSEATGLGQTAIRNYESGYRIPQDVAKITLARYYGVPVGELFYDDDYTNRAVS